MIVYLSCGEGLLQAHIVAPWAAVGTLPRTGEPKYISQYEHAYKFSKLCILLYRSCFVIVTVLQCFKWLKLAKLAKFCDSADLRFT